MFRFRSDSVEPPNKGHVGNNINSESAVLSFIEKLSSFRGSKCTKSIRRACNCGTSNSVLCREVYYAVSLFRRVHYRRFHCIEKRNGTLL